MGHVAGRSIIMFHAAILRPIAGDRRKSFRLVD
jgi:hypothetical protein